MQQSNAVTEQGLKDDYRHNFLIGVAVNIAQIEKTDLQCNALILRQFNAMTPENCMKAHPDLV